MAFGNKLYTGKIDIQSKNIAALFVTYNINGGVTGVM